jgi:hypothetical protein
MIAFGIDGRLCGSSDSRFGAAIRVSSSHADRCARSPVDCGHADRHLPEYRHSSLERDLELRGAVGHRDAGAHHDRRRARETTVSNIDIESTSIRGNSVIKLYFQLCATFNQTC